MRDGHRAHGRTGPEVCCIPGTGRAFPLRQPLGKRSDLLAGTGFPQAVQQFGRAVLVVEGDGGGIAGQQLGDLIGLAYCLQTVQEAGHVVWAPRPTTQQKTH
jgi:hypothetical protein